MYVWKSPRIYFEAVIVWHDEHHWIPFIRIFNLYLYFIPYWFPSISMPLKLRYNVRSHFRNLWMEVFNLKGNWHSSNTASIMVHRQAMCIITMHSLRQWRYVLAMKYRFAPSVEPCMLYNILHCHTDSRRTMGVLWIHCTAILIAVEPWMFYRYIILPYS